MQAPLIACTRCGLCCKKAHLITDFPEPLREDGSCIHLQADNRCAIYDDRPDICNSRTLYERIFIAHLSEAEYRAMNAASCASLMEEAGIAVPDTIRDAL